MPRKRKQMGKGAMVGCLLKLLHPSALLSNAFPNAQDNFRLHNMIVLRLEKRKIRRKECEVVVVQSDMVMDGDEHIEIYAATKHFTVQQEGRKEDFFVTTNPTIEINQPEGEEEVLEPLPEQVVARQNSVIFGADDVAELEAVVETDNDNEPAPENVPTVADNTNPCVYNENWGHDGICFRKTVVASDVRAERIPMTTLSLLGNFETFFPVDYLKKVIIPETRRYMETKEPLEYGEFLRFLGLWLLMATIQGAQRHEFFKRENLNLFSGAPFRLNVFMSKNRFDDILQALTYTATPAPTYKDGFHEVRDLIDAWNTNMDTVFKPSWVSCVDESMSIWNNRWTCPGFMFVPRKPHPLGNEYHTVCCGESGILWRMELVEGKSRPPERPKDQYESKNLNTVGLLVRITKPLAGTGKVIVLDSGFCVLKGLTELRQKGIFAAALIKKRRYWPKYIEGDNNNMHFAGQEVGYADARKGTLDGVPFYVMGMVEPDYVMYVMTTYGTLERKGKTTERVWKEAGERKSAKFQYPEVISNHFLYRHCVDDHNNRRHSPIGLETTWATKRWENRVFAFLFAVTEVNCLLSYSYFDNNPTMSTIDFRKLLAKELINNKYIAIEQTDQIKGTKRASKQLDHEHVTLPAFKKFQGVRLVPHNMEYPQFKCKGCPRKVRRYCRCNPGIFYCVECYANHIREADVHHGTPVRRSGPTTRQSKSC